MVLLAFFLVYFMCLGSSARPSIFGNGLVASILLLMVILKELDYSAGSGVKRVDWDFCVDDEDVVCCDCVQIWL